MYARGSELHQETHASNGNPVEKEHDTTDVASMKKSNGNEGNCESPLLEIDENYVCDIAMMRIGGGEEAPAGSLSMKHNAHMDESSGGNNENEVEIDRQEEEQAVSDLVRLSGAGALMEADSKNIGSMRVIFGILVRLVLPLANGVARGIKGIRDVRVLRVLQNLASSRQALTNLVAFAANTISLNLSSVQVSNRLGPLMKLLKMRKSQDGLESLPDTLTMPSTPSTPCTPMTPMQGPPIYSALSDAPSCCTINILAEPPPGQPIRADIVLIHGLHGSLVNTWKQGLWQNDRQPVEFERPPRPPVRPPKRPRHSRSAAIHPAPREKRAKFASLNRKRDSSEDAPLRLRTKMQHSVEARPEGFHFNASDSDDDAEDYAYVCGGPEDIQICEGIEYSFPTFRLRMHDNSRLLQAELESMLEANAGNNEVQPDADQAKDSRQRPSTLGTPPRKPARKSKPSPNDPNYSKCWPGDWLPLDCPGVRVIAVNYTTDPYLWRPLWKRKEPRSSLMQRAREMAELLIQHRVGHGHPIIYVGHSKGGLFIKQLIVDAWESGRPAMTPLWRSARGCFFYSVPHRGSHLASIKAPLLSRSVELLEIEKNNKYLLDLHRRFAGLYHLGHLKIEVFSFVETALTLMSVLYLRIVGVDSADPGIGDVCGIRLDHREICKPRGRDCILYKELVKMIEKVC
ncbi:uncharacterized protein Dana_GF16126, isoform C [Drosophila ananassae]|uniref:Uncharacterized protein, isoform A n=1 Tax=Drosophila ananassae TaxID=7217 RepID=B3M0I5_DROAN|nr:uncharacterized protein LOC6498923 [Drosophila ananassae]XP_014765823.1 uncharacterized protein LOC6498923 [Drosophila ananassae]XP_014765824.1 uncharacterized protein LOC6498923 [Drosophila ananassae]EDV44232.1 uncharacterized protein Dana_GF16126, isoform A [Drosophila ananassae]KPU80704.1 uncharacterized protein Dana_GF16126, isoform B [Drosophila ananassae]KPU80705.1 uncharacterized protein Dana_GF16126, isoform C [Drosophila ananassae]